MAARSRWSFTGWADKVGIWWGILGPNGVVAVIMSGLYAFYKPVAEQGFAAIVLSGIASAALLLLFISVAALLAASAWRKIKPLDTPSPAVMPNDFMTPADQSKLRQIDERLDALSKKVEAIRVDLAIVSNNFEKLTTSQREQYENLRSSLHSIYIREILAETSQDIERFAAELYDRLSGGETYTPEQWEDWDATHQLWESALSKWVYNGQWFVHGLQRHIYEIDERKYGLDSWTVKDNQVPDSEAMRRFKKHRIMHEQWRIARPVVERGVIDVAFTGLTMRDAQQRRIPQ
jgi:hypothetical protein